MVPQKQRIELPVNGHSAVAMTPGNPLELDETRIFVRFVVLLMANESGALDEQQTEKRHHYININERASLTVGGGTTIV
jgi:hypothetical protein